MNESIKEGFEKQVNELHWMDKARAIGLLRNEKETKERLKPIYEDVDKSNARIINCIEIGNIVIVKIGKRKDEYYVVYIDNKRVRRITYDLDVALLIALSFKYDHDNTRAHEYISKMLGIKESDGSDT